MSSRFVVDTHAILWFAEGNSRLSKNARVVLEDTEAQLFLPVTAFAEACWTIIKGRTIIQSLEIFRGFIDNDPRITVVPMDRQIVERSLTLDSVGEMHDRQIVATALQLAREGGDVVLITRDENITAAAVITTLW